MKQDLTVALVHNRYQHPGGEDAVFAAEHALLAAHAHEVLTYCLDNALIERMGRIELARTTLWNTAAYQSLRRLFAEARPTIAHFHNTFPLISPAAYYAARREGIPVVQTLHNYRLACPNAMFFRQGRICESCLGRAVPWPGVVHACYRGSRPASAVGAAMLALHRAIGTWNHAVDTYVALSEFSRRKFIESGIPADKVVVKPNFLTVDPGVGDHDGRFALFVGRLVPEKGIATLIAAWRQLAGTYRLKIVGAGPLGSLARHSSPNVEWLGWRSREDVHALMREASFLVFPSEWYETFGLTLIEAFATGLPVIASALGAAAEIVRDHETGRLFAAGEPDDLAAKVEWAVTHPAEGAEMGRAARRDFEAKYTAEQNYRLLLGVYRHALGNAPEMPAALRPDSSADA